MFHVLRRGLSKNVSKWTLLDYPGLRGANDVGEGLKDDDEGRVMIYFIFGLFICPLVRSSVTVVMAPVLHWPH